jgi:2-methylcitrate dehydratase PrpD
MSWERVQEKFEHLATPFVDTQRRQEIVEAVGRLETLEVRELMALLNASLIDTGQ